MLRGFGLGFGRVVYVVYSCVLLWLYECGVKLVLGLSSYGSNFLFPGVNVSAFVRFCSLFGVSHAWKSSIAADIFVRYVSAFVRFRPLLPVFVRYPGGRWPILNLRFIAQN